MEQPTPFDFDPPVILPSHLSFLEQTTALYDLTPIVGTSVSTTLGYSHRYEVTAHLARRNDAGFTTASCAGSYGPAAGGVGCFIAFAGRSVHHVGSHLLYPQQHPARAATRPLSRSTSSASISSLSSLSCLSSSSSSSSSSSPTSSTLPSVQPVPDKDDLDALGEELIRTTLEEKKREGELVRKRVKSGAKRVDTTPEGLVALMKEQLVLLPNLPVHKMLKADEHHPELNFAKPFAVKYAVDIPPVPIIQNIPRNRCRQPEQSQNYGFVSYQKLGLLVTQQKKGISSLPPLPSNSAPKSSSPSFSFTDDSDDDLLSDDILILDRLPDDGAYLCEKAGTTEKGWSSGGPRAVTVATVPAASTRFDHQCRSERLKAKAAAAAEKKIG
ncbi:hypothetical protein JCM1840_002370 [Sporobolomyces johnsonii]